MSVSYTTANLLASIKKRGGVPTSQATFENEDFLRFANEELQMGVVPFLMAIREEYFVTSSDVALVSGQTSYNIPTRAIGGKLRDLVFVNTGNQIVSLSKIQVDQIPSMGPNINSGNPNYFYFQGNYVYVLPMPNSGGGTIRMYYFLRPNDMVETSACGTIAGMDTTLHTVTLNAVPSTMVIGTICDFVQALPPFQTLAQDSAITNVSSTTLTFSSLPTGLAIGDFLCLAKESPVPQIPVELHPLLAQRVVVKCLESLGDREGMNFAQAKLDKMEIELRGLMANRVEGEAQKIVNPNSLLNYIGRRDWV